MENQPVISLRNRPHFNDCVQWNQDGQIAVCIENQVHVITPLLVGISSKEESYKHVGLTLPKYEPRTVANAIIMKAEEVETSLFNEEGFRCANWSETGSSLSQSCILVIITTKHRVLLYQSNPSVSSDWQLMVDMTSLIQEHHIAHSYPTKINPHHTLYASWSHRIIMEEHINATKPSLLATTNKAGDVCIWKVDTNRVEYCATITPHNAFVNFVQWTSWKKESEENTYTAYILSSSTNGTVSLSYITLKAKLSEDNVTIIENEVLTSVLFTWFETQPSIPTLVKLYDNLATNSPFISIAVCKGITLYFFSLTVLDDNSVTLDRDFSIYDLDNTALGLSAGTWLNEFQFRGYTTEGQGLLFYLNAEGEITLDPIQNDELNQRLVRKYKQQWMDQQAKVDDDDILCASDALPFLYGAADSPHHLFTAVQFALRPAVDIHYGSQTHDETLLTFIIQKPRKLDPEWMMEAIDTYVNDPYFFFRKPVRGILHEILEFLVEDEDTKLFEKWLEKLQSYMKLQPSNLADRDLTKAIFCEPSTIASRIITNAQIELAQLRLLTYDEEFGRICQNAQNNTFTHYISLIFNSTLQLPDDQFSHFSHQDQIVLLLLADFSLTFGAVPQTLEMYMKLQDKFPQLNLYAEIAHTSSKMEESFKPAAREKCPVCEEHVQPISGTGNLAQCGAGHFWELCTITRRVLYSPSTRKCITCGSKSLQVIGDNSLTDMILKHCSKCVYCGGALI